MKEKSRVFSILFFLLTIGCWVQAGEPQGQSPGALKGEGLVTFQYKKKIFRFHQVTVIPNPSTHIILAGYDDFGNEIFKTDLDGKKDQKRLRKRMPVSVAEFIDLLLYRVPMEGGWLPRIGSSGRMIGLTKKVSRKGTVFVSYEKFKMQKGIIYPRLIIFSFPKGTLKISWQQVQLR